MFTVLSVVLFMWVLVNGNLDVDALVLMLVFGWECFIGIGLLLDGIVVLSIITLLLLIAVGIVLIVRYSIIKKKRAEEDIARNNEAMAEEYYGGR